MQNLKIPSGIFSADGDFVGRNATPLQTQKQSDVDYDNRNAWYAMPDVIDPSKPDIFVIYPTVVLDPALPLSVPLQAAEMHNGVKSWLPQLYNFGTLGNVFIPKYRQCNLARLQQKPDHFSIQSIIEKSDALADVETAFCHYWNHLNAGRRFIIIGHSQGAHCGGYILRNLLSQPTPAERKQMLRAVLAGCTFDSETFAGIPYKFGGAALEENVVKTWNTAFADESVVPFTALPDGVPHLQSVHPVTQTVGGAPAQNSCAILGLRNVYAYYAHTRRDNSTAISKYCDNVYVNSLKASDHATAQQIELFAMAGVTIGHWFDIGLYNQALYDNLSELIRR
jgi:hypothetical protein